MDQERPRPWVLCPLHSQAGLSEATPATPSASSEAQLFGEGLQNPRLGLGASSILTLPGLTEKLPAGFADCHILQPEGVHQRCARALDWIGVRNPWAQDPGVLRRTPVRGFAPMLTLSAPPGEGMGRTRAVGIAGGRLSEGLSQYRPSAHLPPESLDIAF